MYQKPFFPGIRVYSIPKAVYKYLSIPESIFGVQKMSYDYITLTCISISQYSHLYNTFIWLTTTVTFPTHILCRYKTMLTNLYVLYIKLKRNKSSQFNFTFIHLYELTRAAERFKKNYHIILLFSNIFTVQHWFCIQICFCFVFCTILKTNFHKNE